MPRSKIRGGEVTPGDKVVAALFGDRAALARQFAGILATDAVQRGIVGPREVGRVWERHVLNCAVLAELVEPDARVVDVGSGAGLPGMVLAITRPDLAVTLVEPMLRRACFLTETATRLGLEVHVVRGRAEDRDVLAQAGEADVVTARAVAPLARLMLWCLPLARVGGRVLAVKGQAAADEVRRDRGTVIRSGGGEPRVRECGVGMVDQPTRVVEVVRECARSLRVGQ